MSDTNQTRLWIGLAFAAGVVLTLGFKDVYPDLERRYRQRRRSQSRRWSIFPAFGDSVTLKDNTVSARNSIALGSTFTLSDHVIIAEGIESTIGDTPLFKIKSLSSATGCEILAKAEFLNGAGNSPKDRVALSIIKAAEEGGLLTPFSGDKIYEGTVGSTGISLAAICRARGYTAHIVIPDDQAKEKSDLLLRLGAEVERVRPAPIVDQNQFVNLARRRAEEHTNNPNRKGRGIFADQFENEANWRAHYEGTGPEIYKQTGGKLDAFVAGAGTGGTISGVALFLKQKETLPDLKVVLADPQGSGLYNRIKYGVMFAPTEKEGTRRRHQVDTIVEGIGINRVTQNFEAGRALIDDAIRVADAQAIAMARWLVERDGIFVGSSSAVNCVAATKLAQQLGPGHRIVTILCDSGIRHMSKFWKVTGTVGGADDVSLDDVLNAK
jgi:cysteine synthase